MIQITGYQIIERVYESSNSLVYRGIEQAGARPVILKLLKQDYPNREELIRYEQEYNITRNLKMADVITAYDLIKYQNSIDGLMMVLRPVQIDELAKAIDNLRSCWAFSLS